jgi:ABC-type phosphonate transport system ATPase subunit
MATALDSDRALKNEGKDQFGFVAIAKRLAPSIVEASKGDGMVIGLEGLWGSGKTSLLNFLRTELVAAENVGIAERQVRAVHNRLEFLLMRNAAERHLIKRAQNGPSL